MASTGWTARSNSPLNLSPIHHSPSQIILHASSEEDSPERYQAKKLHREELGREYLRERPPRIITAGLRGPLHQDWSNPWAHSRQPRFNTAYVVPGRGSSFVATSNGGASSDSTDWNSQENRASSEDSERSEEEDKNSRASSGVGQRRHLNRRKRARMSTAPSPSADSEDYSSDQEDARLKMMSARKRTQKGNAAQNRNIAVGNAVSDVKTDGCLRRLSRSSAGVYERASNVANLSLPTPHVLRKRGQKRSPALPDSPSSGEPTSDEEISYKLDSATRLNDAIKEASRTKEGKSKEDTLALAEGAQDIPSNINATLPDISLPILDGARAPPSSPLPHKRKKSKKNIIPPPIKSQGTHVKNRSIPVDTRAHEAAAEIAASRESRPPPNTKGHPEYATGSDQPQREVAVAKKRKKKKNENNNSYSGLQSSARTSERQGDSSTCNQDQARIQLPVDFWIEPVKGLLKIAALAKAMREGMTSLTPERLQQKYQPTVNQSQLKHKPRRTRTSPRSSQQSMLDSSLTYVGKAAIGVSLEKESSAMSKSPHVLPPSTSLAEFQYSRNTTAPNANRPPTINTKTAKEKNVALPSPNIPPSASSNAGPRSQEKEEQDQFRTIQASKMEVRIPIRSSQDFAPQQLAHEQSTTSEVLQDAQMDLQQPEPNNKVPSGPSTNLIETDEQSLKFMNSEEGNSGFVLSTQAQMMKAQRSFQLDLMSPEKAVAKSSPVWSSRRRTRSMGQQDFHITPFGAIRSPSTHVQSRESEYSDPLPFTQDLIDGMTPFVITTAKKPSQKRIANTMSSPSKQRATRKVDLNGIGDDTDKESIDTQATPGDPDSDYRPVLRKYRSPLQISPDSDSMFAPKQRLQSQASSQTKPSKIAQRSSPPRRRNARGHFSSPKSSPFKKETQKQSSPSTSKSRKAVLRSFPSSLSGSQSQQDGQQYLHAGWTLEDAIDEAGSYLGTWDVEKEVGKGNKSRFGSSQG